MDSDRMGAMLERDFRGVLAETGKASLAFPLASGTLTVDAFCPLLRDGKRVPSAELFHLRLQFGTGQFR